MEAVMLILSDSQGIYIPQNFIEKIVDTTIVGSWSGIGESEKAECLKGPKLDTYWEAWDDILDNARYHHPDGSVYTLHQDGDLFMLCLERMTIEEKRKFGFDIN
jgi:hypothetical protein